jgi:predicted transcriptional regulator
MNLRDLFTSLVRNGIDAVKAFDIISEHATTQPSPDSILDGRPAVEAFGAGQPNASSQQPKRRLGNGPRVAYVLTDKAKRHVADRTWDPTTAMFNTQAQTFAAIVKARRPVSARELEGLTGLVRKTIESTVYHLRTDGWIESVNVQPNGSTQPTTTERAPMPVPTEVQALLEQFRSELHKTLETAKAVQQQTEAPTTTKRRTRRKSARKSSK